MNPQTELDITRTPCPEKTVSLRLPIAAIAELDSAAAARHITRQELLRQVINTARLEHLPHLPSGDDPLGRLLDQRITDHRRSLQLSTHSTAHAQSEHAN